MLSNFILGEHESVEVLADAICAAQIAKRAGSYGGNFADVELSADEVAFFFQVMLAYFGAPCCVNAFYANIPLNYFSTCYSCSKYLIDPVTIVSVWSSTYSFPQCVSGYWNFRRCQKEECCWSFR